MNSMWKRSFALLLSLVMVFGMVPVNAFAEETECSHSYEATVTDPTCTAVGYTTYTCACGDTYTDDEVAATGHSYADGICSVCGAEEHTHSYEAVVTAPTCGEAGFTTYTCACGDTYTADEVAATGHSYADGICSVCGAEEPVDCDGTENCAAETHETTCECYDPCVALGCTDDAHAEGCPYTIPCDLNEGCKKHKGHYGECEGMIVYTEPVAQVDGETFATLADAVTAAGSEGKITLLADAELVIETTAYQPARNVHVGEIDLGGKTMTLGQTDYRFGNTTIKNGKIVVKPDTVSKTAIFYMFGDNTLVFDNVTVEATGVSGTYLVGLNDTSDFKMQNRSKIVVENDSTVSLGTLVASYGSNNTVTIENSEISAQNLGHGFLGGNHYVSGSTIQLTGMKSSGYYLKANQNLNVADKSKITVTGDAKYGQIYQTDLTAKMTVDESSTVTAKVVNAAHVAYIGETGYVTLDAALKAAVDGDTIELVWSEGKAPISMKGEVTGNKTVTITGKALVNWHAGWLFVGRSHGTATGDGKLIFKDAELWTEDSSGDKAIHVSGKENGAANKNNGTLELINSEIELDYLINKGNVIVNGGELKVKYGFDVAGRPANETVDGEDATATFTVTNGAAVTILNEQNMGFGREGKGILNINGGSFTVQNDMHIRAKGTVNVDVGSKFTASAISGDGKIVIDAKEYAAGMAVPVDAEISETFIGTVETINSKLVKAEIKDGRIVFIGAVAKIGEEGYYSLADALAAAKDGDTVELLSDVTGGCTVDKSITLKGNGKKLTGDVVVKANTTFKGDFAVSGNVKAGFEDHSVSNMEVIVDGNLSAGYFYLGNKSEHYPNGGEHKLTINSGAVLDAGTLYVRTTGVMTAVNATVKAGDLYVRGTMTVDGCTMSHQSTVNGGTGHWTIYEDDDATKTASLTLNKSTASSNYLVVGSNRNSETDANSNAVLTVNGGSLNLNTLYVLGKADKFANNAATFTNAELKVKNAFVHADALMNVSGSTVAAETIKNDGAINVSGNSKLTAPNVTGGTVNVAAGTVLTDTTLGGEATASFKTGVITFNGENKITTNIDDSVSNFDFVVNKGATLLIPRYTLGYGRDITVNGNIVDASAFKPGDATPSLKANSSSGFSIGGTGTGTTALTAENAYLEFDSSSWKNAYGIYNWNFKNSYVSAASFGNNKGPASDSAAWNVTFDDSVLVSNYIKTGKGVTYSFTNNSTADVNTIGIDGVLNIDATSTVTVKELQNNKVGIDDEHGDIQGTVNVAGKLIFGEKGSSMDLLGGKINVLAGGEMAMSNKILYTDDDAVLTVAVGGTLSTAAIEGDCKIVIDAKNYKYGDASPVIGKVSTNDIEVINNEYVTASKDEEGNIVLTGPTVYTKDKDGKTIGGYTNLEKAITAASTNTAIKIIEVQADINQASAENSGYHDVPGDLTICSAEGGNYKVNAPFGIRVMGNGAKLTIAENVTIENLRVVANGFGTTNESMVINGALKAESLKQWTNNNSITVNPTGTVELGYGDGQFDMANGNGTVTVTGNGNKTVAQFKAGYSGTRGNGNALNLKDTYFEAGAWLNIGGKNGTFNADNALLKVSGGDFAGALNVTGTGNVFNLTNGSEMNAGSIALGAGNTINVSADSKINAATISGAGKLVIDATGMTAGVYQNVKGNVANFTGTIEVVNNDTVVAKIVADEGAATKHIELVDVVAVVDGKGYATLEEAVAVADGKTITLMKDVLDGKTFTTPIKIDLNENTLEADFYGTLTMNGGTYRNANGFRMVAPETANDASTYAYNSSDAVLKISAEGIDITKGTMTIGLADGMVTDPDHKLQLLNDAKLVIPQGKPLVLRGEAKVASTATVEGTILLKGNGTITTAKELSVASATADRKVVYVDGAYKLVSGTAKAVIRNQGYDSLADAIKNAKPGETIKLVEDITENVQINDAVTVDLNGKTLTGKITSKNDSAKVKSNGVTIELGKEDAVTSDSTGVLTVAPNLDEVGYGSVKISKNGVTTTYFTSKDTKTGQLATVTVSANGDVKTHGKVIVGAQANGKPAYNYTITQSNVHSNNHVRNTSPDMVISCNGFLAACDRVYITGGQYGTGIHDVYKNGSAQNGFSVVDGSTQVTLSQAYLNSLHDGSYTMVFKYKDGEQVKAPFVVSTYYNANADKTNPKTGDEIALPMFVMFSTAAALAVLVMGKKKHF